MNERYKLVPPCYKLVYNPISSYFSNISPAAAVILYIYMYPYVYQLSDSELGHHFVYPPIKSNVAMEIPYNRGFELINHLETMDCSMLRSCKSWLGLGVQETIAGERKQTLCCPLGSTGHRCGFRNGGSSMLGCWAVGAEAVANLKKVDMCVYIYNLYIYYC